MRRAGEQSHAESEWYTGAFYEKHLTSSRRSAATIVPYVLELLHPKSVVDVGCGVGTWLWVFKEHGVDDILGIDGAWVDTRLLKIPDRQFSSCNLEKPLQIGRQFDLVVSVEVAEHIPSECAGTFVDSLAGLGPVVLFSAAIPFQGGANHVNEQWPDYWAGYFREKGYVAIDCLRKRIWQNDNVEWWYAQNLLLFARADYLKMHPVLKKEFKATVTSQLSIVHPKAYLAQIEWLDSLTRMSNKIAEITDPGDLFILVDEGVFGNLLGAGGRPLPFPEANGQYAGVPDDAAAAIRELERQRETGARFIIFTAQAFWWLEYYSEFHRYLRRHFRSVLEDDLLVVFNLKHPRAGTTPPAMRGRRQ